MKPHEVRRRIPRIPAFLAGATLLGTAVLLGAIPGATRSCQAGGELYGTVITVRGVSTTGSIRWDRNENFWDDFLDSSKAERILMGSRTDSVTVLGIKLLETKSRDWVRPTLTVPFGHVERIERRFRRDSIVTLKNGDTLRLRRPTGDLGNGVRDLVVDSDQGERVQIEWDEVRSVEFAQGPQSRRDAQRLHGTVTTTAGDFTGFVVWDRDEGLLEDVLNGEEDQVEIEVPFAEIASLRRASESSCEVTLRDGTVRTLSGTNDVNSSNRGIDVTIPDLGRVQITWAHFRQLTLSSAPSSPSYSAFDGGYRLAGMVRTTDGRELRGAVIWDKDERHSWEALDGKVEGTHYSILFKHVASIQREGDGVRVTLHDGRELRLSEGNDVDADNKGILVVTKEGDVEVSWEDFDVASFERP